MLVTFSHWQQPRLCELAGINPKTDFHMQLQLMLICFTVTLQPALYRDIDHECLQCCFNLLVTLTMASWQYTVNVTGILLDTITTKK